MAEAHPSLFSDWLPAIVMGFSPAKSAAADMVWVCAEQAGLGPLLRHLAVCSEAAKAVTRQVAEAAAAEGKPAPPPFELGAGYVRFYEPAEFAAEVAEIIALHGRPG